MREVPVLVRDGVPSEGADALLQQLRRHATLQDVLDWCRAQTPPRDLANVVVQDEFTHDVILELGGGLFAVHDTT